MELLLQSVFNILVQVAIYLFNLDAFYKLNNATPSLQDYFFFACYVFTIFFIIRLVSSIPLYALTNKVNKRLAKFIYIFLETFFIVFSLASAIAYIEQGLHLYDKVVIKTFSNPNANREVNLGIMTFVSFSTFCAAVLGLQWSIRTWLSEKLNFSSIHKSLVFGIIALITFNTSFGVFAYQDFIPSKGEISNVFPFYSPLKGTPKQEKLSVAYEFPEHKDIKLNKKRDILFIMAESLRSDFLTPERMPNVSQFIQENSCATSNQHFSGGHTTEYGIFTALHGVYGYHYDDFYKNQIQSMGLKVLQNNGYRLFAHTASQLKNWNNAGFIFNIFDEYHEEISKEIHQDDKRIAENALQQIAQHQNDDKFIFLFFNSTHHNYFYPPEFEKYKPVMSDKHNYFLKEDELGTHREKVFNRYKNSALYLDYNVNNFLKSVMAQYKGKTPPIIVFSGDHGEEFWEEGLLGHAKTNYINPKVKVPFMICGLEHQLVHDTLSSHVDIFPTILDELGADKTFLSKVFNGYSLIDNQLENRPYVVVVGTQFPYGRNKIGFIDENYKFWLKKPSSKLHQLYKYRTTDLLDNNILDGSDQEALQNILQKFSNDAYKFLKPIGQAITQ